MSLSICWFPGNRARWIGFGTLLIAFSQLLAASPNFLIPSVSPQLSTKQVEDRLVPPTQILERNATVRDFFAYPPLDDRLPDLLQENVIARLDTGKTLGAEDLDLLNIQFPNYTKKNAYSMDEPLISEVWVLLLSHY
jgi:hypothetical protein